ncbi:hypothetical protein GCM10009865_05290 [Aeromicrobium ponti]|uniref:LysR substrate binding domain-containing protein n=1 Tax=Cytobacillus oceanisediminis TaxID=665099 RepID=A0A562K6E8_9BACI|nr:LysR substrate binding domain-containing protein [Cytobacillus oceanisediminis]
MPGLYPKIGSWLQKETAAWFGFQTMELWSIEAIKKIVMTGLGFCALPYITVKEDVESGKLKILPHSEKFEPIYSHMLIKKKKWLSPAVKAFVELVLKSISEWIKEWLFKIKK